MTKDFLLELPSRDFPYASSGNLCKQEPFLSLPHFPHERESPAAYPKMSF